jgi:hypothetical protein
MTDSLGLNSTNKYRIHKTPDQDIIISITVFEGNLSASIIDLKNNIRKNKYQKNNMIHFRVYNNKN